MSHLAHRLLASPANFIGEPNDQESDMQAVFNAQLTAQPALVQYDLDMDDTPVPVSAHERVGLALARDYALHGITPPIAHL